MKLETFKTLHGFFIEDLQLDQTDKIERKITQKDIDNFAKLTGDNNPVHTNLDFAKKTIFKQKVAHGFLSASLISTLIATKLPGPGSIYLSQNIKFLAPVFIGDVVRVKVTIQEIDYEKKKVKLQTKCFKNEKKIISGEAIVLVNSRKDFQK